MGLLNVWFFFEYTIFCPLFQGKPRFCGPHGRAAVYKSGKKLYNTKKNAEKGEPSVKKTSARLRPQDDTRARLFGALLLLGAMALLAILNSKITLYSDDYWYGTFFDEGISAFWQKMAQHYRETNGRFYVHLIVPAVLLFDTKLFLFLSPALLALLYYFGAKMLDAECSAGQLLVSAALGMLCTLACDVRYLRMTVLWISAYFNYVFPLCMTAIACVFQLRHFSGKQSRAGHAAGLLFAVLAGASTEQAGIMSLVVIWGCALLYWIFAKTPFRRCWSYPVFALAGFLTILLAPGSWARVDRGVDGGILSCLHPTVFLSRFFDAMIYMVRYRSTVLLLVAVDTLAAFLCMADRRLTRWLLTGLVMAAGQIGCFLLGLDQLACVWMVVSQLALAVMFLLQRAYWPTALMILASVAGNMVLIITTLGSERTAFEPVVALIIVAVSLLTRVLRTLPRAAAGAVTGVLVLVCVCAYLPTLRGYTESKKIVDENLAAIERGRDTGVCELNIDIDERYRFTMFFEGSYFLENFKRYYDIPDSTKLVYQSERWALAQIASGDTVYDFPTVEDETGLYFPVEFAVQSAGGTAVWSWKNQTYTITLDGNTYFASLDGHLRRYLPEGGSELLSQSFTILLPYSETYTLLYCPANELREQLGIDWVYDAQANCYAILPG